MVSYNYKLKKYLELNCSDYTEACLIFEKINQILDKLDTISDLYENAVLLITENEAKYIRYTSSYFLNVISNQ